MTTTAHPTESATAASSGASATERFHADKSPFAAVKDTPQERIDVLAREVLDAVHETIRKHKVSYDEFNALKAWLINVGEDGEWPLFLDVGVEHVVEDVAHPAPRGQQGLHRGPLLRPGRSRARAGHHLDARGRGRHAARVERHGHLDRRHSPRRCQGRALTRRRRRLLLPVRPGHPGVDLRGSITVGDGGALEIHTVQPAPYQIPTDGSCGKLIAAAGWHPWRPAHLHVKVSAPGHELLTAQLYFPGDEHNDDDVASAVKPELILAPTPKDDGSVAVEYGFVLDPVKG